MNKAKMALAAGLVVLLHSVAWITWKGAVRNIEQENGWMENFQAICLLLSVFMWIWAALRSKVTADKILFGSLALFTGSILVLEVDFRQMQAPLLNAVMNGKIRDLWLGTFWVIAAILFFRHCKPVFLSFLAWIKTPGGILMLLSGVFWILSALIDKSLLGRKDLFNEELMEVNATLLMIASAFLNLRSQSKNAQAAELAVHPAV